MRRAQFNRTGGTPSANPGTAKASNNCGCGCHQQATANCGCCKLACFERPKYFCGQLLSDADLTLQESYFREKNRLYHRTMDGYGVVGGLRMYCDARCKGNITIGEGFAIDACGNDLVICDPLSFDVIGELRRKKWLVEPSRDRARLHEDREHTMGPNDVETDNCITTQCFYIGLCYTEEPVDFATPYTTECNPAPGPCQPTRIREGVRLEIYDEMPVRPNPLDEIGKQIEGCFKMFREGQFSRSLARITPGILEILQCDPQQESQREDANGLFKELQAQFLHELHACPDPYNCDLEREVYRLRPPDRNQDRSDTGAVPLEPFTRLFQLIQKYVFSCVLAQLAFSCPEPPDSSSVLIGSVEIENGGIKRVINHPRWYLWCFANFFQVLLYTIANDAACGTGEMPENVKAGEERKKPKKSECCPEYEIDVCEFLNLFSADHCAFEKAARISVDAIKASYSALVGGFNFTRPGGIAPSVLRNLDRATAERLTKMLGLNFEPSTEREPGRRDVFGALTDNTIHFRSETLVYDTDDTNGETGNTIKQVKGVIGAPAFAVGPYTHSMFTDIMERLTSTEARLRHCENKLGVKSKQEPPAPAGPGAAPPTPPPTPPPAPTGGIK